MASSYNGFKAGDPSVFTPPGLDDSPIPGTEVRLEPGVHRGDIATVLFYVAAQLNERVEPPHEGWCWGYAYRPSKNDSNIISCHASGTAFDYNAPNHPNGKAGTFTKAQVAEIRKILAEVDGVVHWGGDGWGTGSVIDEMHFEIREGVSMMQLNAVAQKLEAPKPKPEPKPAPKPVPAPKPKPKPVVDKSWSHAMTGVRVLHHGMRGDDVGNLQGRLAANFPLYRHDHGTLTADGIFGGVTEAWVREFQSRSGLTADGIVGRKTFHALGY